MKGLAEFVRQRRKEVNLTQVEFAERAGVALTVVRKIEQGKTNLNMEKVNLVLKMFGHELAPVNSKELLEVPSRKIIFSGTFVTSQTQENDRSPRMKSSI